MEACLEAGCHYIDLGGLYHVTEQQLELSPRFEQRGLIAMLGVGSAPGKTNLMATRAVRDLGGEADAIRWSPPGATSTPRTGFAFPYALQTLLDEITMPPMALIDGEPRELEPLQPAAHRRLRRPDRRGRDDLHPALGGAHVRRQLRLPGTSPSRSRLPPKVLESLRGPGGGERGADRRGRALRIAPVGHHRLGSPGRGHRAADRTIRARSVTQPHEGWGLGGGIVSTASPAAAAVRLLARRRDRRDRERCRPSAASTPTRCSPSSSPAESASTCRS